jgi:hypothetical protein
MANPFRGEVGLTVNGEPHNLRLSLGALVELEADLGETSVLGLVERIEAGELSSRDILAIVRAGLFGAGVRMALKDVADAEIDGGAIAIADAAARLIARAFGVPGDAN